VIFVVIYAQVKQWPISNSKPLTSSEFNAPLCWWKKGNGISHHFKVSVASINNISLFTNQFEEVAWQFYAHQHVDGYFLSSLNSLVE